MNTDAEGAVGNVSKVQLISRASKNVVAPFRVAIFARRGALSVVLRVERIVEKGASIAGARNCAEIFARLAVRPAPGNVSTTSARKFVMRSARDLGAIFRALSSFASANTAVSFCVEPCPTKCRVCHPETLDVIMRMTLEEYEETDRFVQLDCGHIFEVSGLDTWMDSNDSTPEQQSVAIKLKEWYESFCFNIYPPKISSHSPMYRF